MELLERDEALTALAQAHEAAARGCGRVVFVTGEPGIGKTALVTRFQNDLGPDARVLLGTCDDLSIPRPLGAFRDLAGCVSAELDEAIAAGAPPHDIHPLLVAELELGRSPTVLILEDVHWADDATLDAITILGRRIGSLPALLVLTVRVGEAAPDHPLHAALGAIPAADSVFIELAPLSESTVVALADGAAGVDVYGATGGNPFYVSELLSYCDAGDLPPSVASAVLGRASRLELPARRLVELVSVVPRRIPISILAALVPDWPEAAEEPERRQLLEVGPRYVHFRHELARHAIAASIPVAARRRFHHEILDVLLATNGDPADIVHHAEAAGADEVIATYARIAARRAAAVGANREAYAHFHRAVDFVDRLPRREQAMLLEELTEAGYYAGRIAPALAATERAIPIWCELDDQEALGRCTRVLSRLHWFLGEGVPAREKAAEAVAILEPLGDTAELACAYSSVAQLAMLAHDEPRALAWGERGLALATRIGAENARVHALVNIASARLQLDPDATAPLLEAHSAAHAIGDRHEAARSLANLGYTLMIWGRPQSAIGYAELAVDYAREHEVHNLLPYIETTVAWLRLRAGEWDDAERIASAQIRRRGTVPELLAKTVLAELAVRRGDADAEERLTDLAERAERAGDLQRLMPVLELTTELALTVNSRMPADRLRQLVDGIRVKRQSIGDEGFRILATAALAGIDAGLDLRRDTPYAAMIRGDWGAAAAAFGEIGWSYDRALMLSLLDEEEALAEAIEIARELGAGPLTRRAARRLRKLGLSVPRGPRETTRANPAGLTARQLEVLTLLAGGLTNAEIAEQLVVSLRTAEHHVAAVLTKLDAATRRDAARRASELGLVAA
ncbi:MAG TPA: AAA family ATPase [Gaiellaceae bacterium]|nr:AAA family ATPase [Gaiellaceae bacterium]